VSDRVDRPGPPDIEARLRDLAAHIDYPPAPDIAAAVRARIAAAPAPRPRLWWAWRRRVAGVALVVVILAALVLGVSPLRTTVAHWLGIRGVEIVPVQTLPPVPTRTQHPSESPAVPGDQLRLGVPVTSAQAQARLGFAPLVPAALGPPDAIWVRDEEGGVLTLVYLPRPDLRASSTTGVGLLLTEFRATTDSTLFRKFVDPESPVLPVSVGGQPGFWIGGAAHGLAYILPDGSGVVDQLRLAGPTLVFQHGALSVRIEGATTEAQALHIADSLPR
jgi:hypothetical protein